MIGARKRSSDGWIQPITPLKTALFLYLNLTPLQPFISILAKKNTKIIKKIKWGWRFSTADWALAFMWLTCVQSSVPQMVPQVRSKYLCVWPPNQTKQE